MFFFIIFILINSYACQISDWGQCGGNNWQSSSTCTSSGYLCYIQDSYYSQCRPAGQCPSNWNCTIYTSSMNNNNVPNALSAWSQCGGIDWKSSSTCVSGYLCYIQDSYFSQCRPDGQCPSNWNCTIYTSSMNNNSSSNALSAYSQCGSNTWQSSSTCVSGYLCYIQNYYYSQCLPAGQCPSNWNCTIYTSDMNDNNTANELPAYSQCSGQNWNSIYKNCVKGFVCYIQNFYFSQCRPIGDCPSGWNCSIIGSNTILPTPISTTSYSSSSSTLTSSYSTSKTSLSSSTSILLTSSTTSSFSTTSSINCLPTQFYNSKLKTCQTKRNYAKACASNEQCNSDIGLLCMNRKYICNCPLVYVGFHYCDCNNLSYYSYSAKRCVNKKSFKSKCSSNYECNNSLGLQCRSRSCICANSNVFSWNGSKCVAN